jgi:hypothetical protein
MTSPDLTDPQAGELVDKYLKDMEAYVKKAIKFGLMGGEGAEDKLEAIRDKALSILKH